MKIPIDTDSSEQRSDCLDLSYEFQIESSRFATCSERTPEDHVR